MRMWKSYFKKSNIFGIDIFDKKAHEENRIKTFKGSQTDEKFLKDIVSKIGKIDIVIDDGSHINEHVIQTFKILFPYCSVAIVDFALAIIKTLLRKLELIR